VFLEKNIIALPGIGGTGGLAGDGGDSGNGGRGAVVYKDPIVRIKRGSGDGGGTGNQGNPGGQGRPGKVTKDLISVTQYLEEKESLIPLFPKPKTAPK